MTYVYNTTQHTATIYTPFEPLFGRPSTIPSALKKPPEHRYIYDDYASELKGRLQTVHQQAHKNLIESKGKSKEHYERPLNKLSYRLGIRFCFLTKICAAVDPAN